MYGTGQVPKAIKLHDRADRSTFNALNLNKMAYPISGIHVVLIATSDTTGRVLYRRNIFERRGVRHK